MADSGLLQNSEFGGLGALAGQSFRNAPRHFSTGVFYRLANGVLLGGSAGGLAARLALEGDADFHAMAGEIHAGVDHQRQNHGDDRATNENRLTHAYLVYRIHVGQAP